MRHRNKNKFTFLLNKYGSKKDAQAAYATLGMERRAVLGKLKELHEGMEKEESSYDEDAVSLKVRR